MKKQIDFFRELHSLSINEIKRELLKTSQGTTTIYNEIVNDYRAFIYKIIGIDQFISFEETKDDFTDHKIKRLKPFDSKKIARFEFEFDPPYKLVFDFITIKPNSIVRLSSLKVSFEWDKETVSRREWETEYKRISVFVFGAFRFREACKLVILDLLEPKTIQPEKAKESTYLGQSMNADAKELFDFLIEHYRRSEKTVVKFVNILHYLKNDTDKKRFIFKVKQDEYKTLVKGITGIEIKKFAKSERYNEDDKPILNSLESSFLKNKTV
ncbi:hypothetical protein [Flavobacterium sp. WC2429]|uniref:Uncharacterized protein n=1 Tax=Flavobacterium sp. WC2429 TaxID=3234140 RepID=A0AB39WLZ2_9FLAO